MIICKDLLREEMREDGYCPVVIRIQHNGKTRFVQTPVLRRRLSGMSPLAGLTEVKAMVM